MIISVGLSPQVVTETLYALQCERGERIDEIYMWTTTDGAEAIERTLIAGGEGALYRMASDYGFLMPAVHIRVFGKVNDAPQGMQLTGDRPLDDIRSLADNQLVADTLMHFIQEQAADPSRRLFCSLAGARKTIGPYLALALQFFGRKGDSLFHVLVPSELERDRSFFYPAPGSPPGLIELIEVPIALLREHLNVLQGFDRPISYSQLVEEVQRELDDLKEPPVLALRTPAEVRIGESRVDLSGLSFVLYAALAARRTRCGAQCPGCPKCFVTMEEVQDALLFDPLQRIVVLSGFKDYRLQRLLRWSKRHSDVDQRKEAFLQTRSRINRKIGTRPGRHLYRVERAEWGEVVGYGIALSPDRIDVPQVVREVWAE